MIYKAEHETNIEATRETVTQSARAPARKRCHRRRYRLVHPHCSQKTPRLHSHYRRIVVVGSTGERNGLCQYSSRGAVSEGLAGSGVELHREQVEVVLVVHGQVALLGQVLSQEPVGFLGSGALPGAFGIAEVDCHVG